MSSYLPSALLLQLTLLPEAVQNLSDTVLQQECDAASTLADAYLRGRYNLPLVSWGLDLQLIVAHIAAYNVLKNRGFNPDQSPDSTYVADKDEAFRMLRDVQRQAMHLGVTDSSPGPATPFPQVFSDSPRGWDPNCGRGGGGVW